MVKLNRVNQWTDEYLNEAKETIKTEDIFPIVVPSYQRGSEALTLKLLKGCSDLKIILYVYADDYENYREVVENNENISAVLCSGFRGLAPKRKFINEDMVAKGYNEYFVLDDDISALFYTRHGQTKAGTYKAEKVLLNPIDFFKMWQYVIKYKAEEEIAVCGIISETGAWCQNLIQMKDVIYVAGQCQILYMNGGLCAKHGVNYREDAGWEDFDFSLRVLNAGLNSCQIRYLTYATPTMCPGQSVATTGANGWVKKSLDLYKHWGRATRFKFMKNQVNSKIRWVSVRNMLKRQGTIDTSYEEEYIPFVENNDAQGLLEYMREKAANK